jgi:hypothetical protein
MATCGVLPDALSTLKKPLLLSVVSERLMARL